MEDRSSSRFFSWRQDFDCRNEYQFRKRTSSAFEAKPTAHQLSRWMLRWLLSRLAGVPRELNASLIIVSAAQTGGEGCLTSCG